MTIQVHIPLALTGAQLSSDGNEFSGDHRSQRFTIDLASPPDGRQVIAPWSGDLSPQPDQPGHVTIQLGPRDLAELAVVWPTDAPLPQRVTVGPITFSADLSSRLGGSARPAAPMHVGDALGTADGISFEVVFEDQGGFALDPAWTWWMLSVVANLVGPVNSPFVPDPSTVGTLRLAGPGPLQPGAAHLVIQGGTLVEPRLIFNPPAELPNHYFSFLSSDAVTIGAFNLPTNAISRLRVIDLHTGPYQSVPRDFVSPPFSDHSIDFLAERDLRPSHQAYGAGGRATPGGPLRYEVTFDAQTTPPVSLLSTVIGQDHIDAIRQEYVFHGPPFQSGDAIEVPDRERFTALPSATGRVGQLHERDNNYASHGVGLDARAAQTAFDHVQAAYWSELFTSSTIDPALSRVVSSDLTVTRAWRNPERNEDDGRQRDDPDQFGHRLNLRPLSNAVPEALFKALGTAGGKFIAAVIAENGGVEFDVLEARLMLDASILWRWTISNAGTLVDSAGPHYADRLSGSPNVEKAAQFADGVEIEWRPTDTAIVPEIPALADPRPGAPIKRTNVILIGTEGPNADDDEQIPLDDAGRTLETFLKNRHPEDDTLLIPVGDPVTVLEALGAFEASNVSLRYVFTLSHAWQGGLQLEHDPEADPDVESLLRVVYGGGVSFGSNDQTEVASHQFRESNLMLLPSHYRSNLRRSTAEMRVERGRDSGFFLVGCKSGSAKGELLLAQRFADQLRLPVWGASNNSLFFRLEGTSWTRHDELRGVGTEPPPPVVLLPDSPGNVIAGAEASVDFVAHYRESLTRFDPTPEPIGGTP